MRTPTNTATGMKNAYTLLLRTPAAVRAGMLPILLLALLPLRAWAQPCLGTYTGGGQAVVPAGNWDTPTIPAPTPMNLNSATTLGSTTVIATAAAAANMFIGGSVSGPGIPPGTTIVSVAGNAVTISQPATATASPVSLTYDFIWSSNVPPVNTGTPGGLTCATCPSLFTADICANNWVTMYLCAGNLYTFSLCNSTTPFNSLIQITNNNNNPASDWAWDDDGCGTPNGLSTVTFAPTTSTVYRIRVLQDPCTVNASLCGTIEISCAPVPPPPPNDEPCTAEPLTVGTTCVSSFGTTAWATQTGGMSPPPCGTFAGFDVWFSAVVPASGNLAIETGLISAPNIAMAVWTPPACNSSSAVWNANYVNCNDDASIGVLEPFLNMSGLPPGQTAYIRVWPVGGVGNTGTFEICAYEPFPPPNDNPCNAEVLPVLAACTPTTYTTLFATPLAGMTLAGPGPCAPVVGGDVWFQVTMPPSGSMTVATQAGSLTDMAMSVYELTAGTICSGTLTQISCNDNTVPGQMPTNVITGTPGNVYYVRMWNKTATDGTFRICAYENFPPPNDNPCGALPLTVRYGCLYDAFSNTNATTTVPVPAPPGTTTVPNPSCGGTPNNDVWYRAVVPPNGTLEFSTDDGQLNNAAMAIYTATGTCASNTLALTQAFCASTGSPVAGNMPAIMATGLPPGQTVYIRVWRMLGPNGSFLMCARRTDPPPGACDFVLTMTDAAGDGWNGSTVEICVISGSTTCTQYTVNGAAGMIVFGANVGAVVTVTYTAAGGFQNEIGYTLRTPDGGLLYGSSSPPQTGTVHVFTVDSECNVPPYPQEDCVGALQICEPTLYTGNPTNSGGVVDLHPGNDGCLAGERRGLWYRFEVQQSGTFAFSVAPTSNQDYDWAMWGPYNPTVICPPQMQPIRCSWSAIQGATGLNFTALDLTEGAGGDGWVRYLDVLAGQSYLMYIDNWTGGGVAFNMTFPGQMTADISCVELPVELLGLEARPSASSVDLVWSTASERNSSHFIVERSADGSRFEPVGLVAAAGNSQSLLEYRFPDMDPHEGVNYYRLQQVDRDDASVYSNTVSALFRNGTRVAVVPNPSQGAADLVFVKAADTPLLARVTDSGGRQLLRFTVPEGVQRTTLPVEALEAGSYQVEITLPDGTPHSVARFVKQ